MIDTDTMLQHSILHRVYSIIVDTDQLPGPLRRELAKELQMRASQQTPQGGHLMRAAAQYIQPTLTEVTK